MYLDIVAAPPGIHRGRHVDPLLRRAVLGILGLTLCVLALLLFAGQVMGGGDAPPSIATVAPGDTLWSIAAQRYPGDDTRSRIEQLMQLNHLPSAQVFTGEHLTLPAG